MGLKNHLNLRVDLFNFVSCSISKLISLRSFQLWSTSLRFKVKDFMLDVQLILFVQLDVTLAVFGVM
jgi:hypothetical protein